MPEHKSFLSFGFRVFLYLVAGLLVSDILMYYVTDHRLGDSYYEAMVVLNVAKHTTLITTVAVNTIIHLLVLVLILATSLVLTHRVSGPMYRFEKVAEAVTEGDLTVNVKLRDKDYMKPQAEDFGLAISTMRRNIGDVAAASGSIREKLARLEDAQSSGEDPGDIVRGMRSDAAAIKEALSSFKTS